MSKLIPVVALALCLVPVAGPALAQTTVGTISVTTEGLPYVGKYCHAIEGMSPSERFDYHPPLAWEVGSGVHLRSIQHDDCKEAGLF